MTDTFIQMPIAALHESPTNPRKSYSTQAMAELVDSIKEKGVLQPILVRPKGRKDAYEIVAGHRRFRASKEAGLTEIPALIRELTDEQALECQVVENLQREDVHPLEEAAGYKALLATNLYGGGVTAVEQLAGKIGRSVRYVYDRLKLGDLCPAAAKALESGELSLSHAIELSRLTSADQSEVVARCLDKDSDYDRPWSVRQLRQHILNQVLRKVSTMPFNVAENGLAGKPSCKECPQNSANDQLLFPDIEHSAKGLCRDASCRKAKIAAFEQRKLKELEKKTGVKPVLVAQSWAGDRSDVKLKHWDIEIVDKDAEGARPAISIVSDEGKQQAVEVWFRPRESSRAALDPEEEKRRKAAEAAAIKFQRVYRKRLLEATMACHAPEPTAELLRAMAETIVGLNGDGTLSVINDLLGWPQPVKPKQNAWNYRADDIKARLPALGVVDLVRLLIGLRFLSCVKVDSYSHKNAPERLESFAANCGVDIKALKQDAKALVDHVKPKKGDPCPACNGTGQADDPDDSKCIACQGTGVQTSARAKPKKAKAVAA